MMRAPGACYGLGFGVWGWGLGVGGWGLGVGGLRTWNLVASALTASNRYAIERTIRPVNEIKHKMENKFKFKFKIENN